MGSLLLVDGDEIHVGERLEVDILRGHDERVDGDLRLLRDELARLCVVGDRNDFFSEPSIVALTMTSAPAFAAGCTSRVMPSPG